MTDVVDISPAPRILRVLGEIPFEPWRCIAELIDNSIDGFAHAKRDGIELSEKQITVKWSSDSVGAKEREIEIFDSGPGMTLEKLQNAARAGYSGNDPINNLGLFGMGFNIATAKLGEKTKLMSTTSDSDVWTGIEIDFAELIRAQNFSAPVIREPKSNREDHGTRITISKLKPDIYARLNQEVQLRRQLEDIYTPLLQGDVDVEILIRGHKLEPRPHCVWGESRYVTRSGTKIEAVQRFDRMLGTGLFDVDRNAYLTADEEAELRTKPTLPENVVERQKRLHGWVGIQRYSDPSDFGIDFVRNGRKILISDKTLFSYENPLTGTTTIEYPMELASTWGGRVVGEIHVDYLIPTYQKNNFERNDITWTQTVEALRGSGPLLPKARKEMNFTVPNSSPIAILANAYRRVVPGTKDLAIERPIAAEYLLRFRRGEHDYISDDKWWEAAQDADRKIANKGSDSASVVDPGSTPSDDPDSYLGGLDSDAVADTTITPAPVESLPKTSELDELLKNSKFLDVWSKTYGYGKNASLEVRFWELQTGEILSDGEDVPCKFQDDGIECDFIFNPRHPIFSKFSIEPRQILLLYLAEKYKARDRIADLGNLYTTMIQIHLKDRTIDKTSLQERAMALFDDIREKMKTLLLPVAVEVVSCIHESAGEAEETTSALLSRADLFKEFTQRQPSSLEVLDYVPYRTILRLVDQFPERLFDGQLFQSMFEGIELTDEKAAARFKAESKDRIISFLKDALWIISQIGTVSAVGRGKEELARSSHSITFLEQEIV